MPKLLRRIARMYIIIFLLLISGTFIFAAPSIEETRKLLQKSLTIYEIDQEISRLSTKQDQVATDLVHTQQKADTQRALADKTRVHAGEVLRAYYMGDRDKMWMTLLSSESLADALAVYEYMSLIVMNDRITLGHYQDSYRGLLAVRKQLEDEQRELTDLKNEFLKQRERVLALQIELDEEIQQIQEVEEDQAAEVINQIEEFTTLWKEQGVPIFNKYMQAMSGAMQSLPELLQGDGAASIKGKSLIFTITAQELNDFFQSKDPMLKNMTIAFENGQFIAFGKDGDIDISIKGKYTIEDEPENRLRFQVDELAFNGYILPDTSNRALEEEFDLGFSPQKHISFISIRATDVTIENGSLTVSLQISR